MNKRQNYTKRVLDALKTASYDEPLTVLAVCNKTKLKAGTIGPILKVLRELGFVNAVYKKRKDARRGKMCVYLTRPISEEDFKRWR